MTVEIDALDQAIERAGQTVTLRRLPNIDVICPATVRDYGAAELIGSIIQGDSKAIISPTQINAAQWPGPQGAGADIRMPSRNRGDTIWINGVERTVQSSNGFYVQGVLCRIEIQVR